MYEFLSTVPVWAWIIGGLITFLLLALVIGDDVDVIDPETWLPELDNTDIITCSVPGQKTIVFNPEHYQYYSVDSYEGFVEIQLINWNLCYVPSMYTTVIDQSFRSVSEKKAV